MAYALTKIIVRSDGLCSPKCPQAGEDGRCFLMGIHRRMCSNKRNREGMFYGLRTPVCIRSEEAARAVIQDVDKVLKEKGPWPEDIKKACIALREDPILPPDDTAAVDLERFRVLEVPNEPDLDFVALEALSDEELGRAIRLALPVIKGLKDRIDQMNDVATSCRTQLEGVIKQLRFGTDPARTGG